MVSRTYLIAGAGYVGGRLAGELAAAGHRVLAARRAWPEPPPPGVEGVGLDLADEAALDALPPVTHVVYAAAAGRFDDEAYRRAYVVALGSVVRWAERRGVERLLFTSSTGVYGVGDGDWVDEASPVARGGPFAASRLLEGEALVAASRVPSVIVRFGGIYGPGRQSLLDAVESGTARLSGGAPQWTNRIHRDDCAGVLAYLAAHPSPEPLYCAVDDEPATKDDVLRGIAAMLGLPPPPVGDDEARSPQRGNRRVRNARLRQAGYRLRFPTWREGFKALVDSASERR